MNRDSMIGKTVDKLPEDEKKYFYAQHERILNSFQERTGLPTNRAREITKRVEAYLNGTQLESGIVATSTEKLVEDFEALIKLKESLIDLRALSEVNDPGVTAQSVKKDRELLAQIQEKMRKR